MRTTLTLEPDVAKKLKKRMAERGVTFKEAVNDALRAGLAAGQVDERPYEVKTHDFGGLRPGIDPHGMNKLLDELEAEDYLRSSVSPEVERRQ